MNLIEARKLAHEGWVRSERQTEGMWVLYVGQGYRIEGDPSVYHRYCVASDLDAEDWEPKPAPAKVFEADIWVHPNGDWHGEAEEDWGRQGWRKIRVKEVVK